MEFTFLDNLSDRIAQIPVDSIVSQTIYNDDKLKAVLFGFAVGQELSEHTAAHPAILHFLTGEARLSLGDDEMDAKPGAWVHMPAHLAHSIIAVTEVKMLLLLTKM